MDKERYSRQTTLFGEDTQKRIENTLVVVLAPKGSFIAATIQELIIKIGGQCFSSAEEGRDTANTAKGAKVYYIVVDRHASPRINTKGKIFYVNTQDISFSKYSAPSAPSTSYTGCQDLPYNVYMEYLNILAGVVVQEYIKTLHGISITDNWRLNIELG